MTTHAVQFLAALATTRGRRVLASRALVLAIVGALLFIPSSCAQMAGPHSIFTDPMAGHAHHHAHGAKTEETGFRSTDQLAQHLVMGHGSPGWVVIDEDAAEEECPTRPNLRDLPTTMSMSAVNAPLTIDDGYTLELPSADEPVSGDAPILHATTIQVELPPPR